MHRTVFGSDPGRFSQVRGLGPVDVSVRQDLDQELRLCVVPADHFGKPSAKACNPIPDRFVGNRDLARGQKTLDVTQAEGKATVRPNRATNDQTRKTEPFEPKQIKQIQHGMSLHGKTVVINLTKPIEGRAADRYGNTPQASYVRKLVILYGNRN